MPVLRGITQPLIRQWTLLIRKQNHHSRLMRSGLRLLFILYLRKQS